LILTDYSLLPSTEFNVFNEKWTQISPFAAPNFTASPLMSLTGTSEESSTQTPLSNLTTATSNRGT